MNAAATEPTVQHRRGVAVLVTISIVAAVGVAVLGGVRSFEAVSARFDSPLVPLTADGMIVACTALRLAALARGWRLPGSLTVTYVFIVGTIWLNVAAAHGWADAVAHGLAPAAYAVLVELLAHMLRLHLRLARPRAARVSALTWFTSPVITTRVWLHLARIGGDDPVAARALVQQVVRMRSRLRSVCPNSWHPFDGARPARTAALHTIRDGLLSAADVAALLPSSDRLTPSELLARIDHAALTTPSSSERPAHPATGPGDAAPVVPQADRTAGERTRTGEPGPVHPVATAPVHHAMPEPVRQPGPVPVDRTEPAPGPVGVAESVGDGSARSERSDEELVADLVAYSRAEKGGRRLSQREVRKVLGVGTPKARRLVEAAGWAGDAAGHDAAAGRGPGETATSDQQSEIDPLQLEMSDAR